MLLSVKEVDAAVLRGEFVQVVGSFFHERTLCSYSVWKKERVRTFLQKVYPPNSVFLCKLVAACCCALKRMLDGCYKQAYMYELLSSISSDRSI